MADEAKEGDLQPQNLAVDLEAEIEAELEENSQQIEAELEEIRQALTPRIQRLREQSSDSTSLHSQSEEEDHPEQPEPTPVTPTMSTRIKWSTGGGDEVPRPKCGGLVPDPEDDS